MELLFLMISIGLGTILPLSTIVIQNAVSPHQLGTALATMNFFRQLGGALIVAAFGTIVLGGLGQGRGSHDMESLVRGVDAAALAHTFRLLFGAADLGLLLALGFLVMMQARPLVDRRNAAADPTAPAAVASEAAVPLLD
jgi:hypothetical protein